MTRLAALLLYIKKKNLFIKTGIYGLRNGIQQSIGLFSFVTPTMK